jgi:hypothetical protein
MVMGARRGTPANAAIDVHFLSQLREYVAAREIECGIACLRIKFFESANRHYGKRDPGQANLARSLANMALAKRGIALQLQKRIDRDSQRRRKTSASTKRLSTWRPRRLFTSRGQAEVRTTRRQFRCGLPVLQP